LNRPPGKKGEKPGNAEESGLSGARPGRSVLKNRRKPNDWEGNRQLNTKKREPMHHLLGDFTHFPQGREDACRGENRKNLCDHFCPTGRKFRLGVKGDI